MTILTLLSRAVLALVFGVAGVAKLADRTGTKRTLESFGLSPNLATRATPVLPILELAVALALVPAATARSAALSALLLLGGFSAAVAVAIARGRRVPCHCFGQLSSGIVGWRTLLRNGILVALAAGVLLAQRDREAPGFGALIAHLAAPKLLVWTIGGVAIALLTVAAWGFVNLLRGHGRLLLRIDALERRLAAAGVAVESRAVGGDGPGLAPGSTAPVLAASDVEGRPVSWADALVPSRPILLLFTSPRCGPCREVLPAIQGWQRIHADRVRVMIASQGSIDEIRHDTREFGLADVLVDRDLQIFNAFGVKNTPSGVHIRPDGKVGSFVAAGPEAIAALYAQIASSNRGSPAVENGALTPGTPVPTLPRYALDEGPRVLADLIQAETLVIFWNPGCGHCRSMRADLQRCERRRPKTTPRLVIISAGDEASVRAEGFESPVLLDPDFSLGRAFGIGGTPMAVLVDAEARIASSVAAGSRAVLALAGGA